MIVTKNILLFNAHNHGFGDETSCFGEKGGEWLVVWRQRIKFVPYISCSRMERISATIITYNEAHRIEACLDSLDGVADEIVVVDSFSSDGTPELCRARGCKVTSRKFTGYGIQRQYATSLASHRYVLAIDADEVLSPALRRSLIALKEKGPDHRVYNIPRLNFFCGNPVHHCGWYPDPHIRLFDKRFANWNLSDVGERVEVPEGVEPALLEGDILHYRCTTVREFRATQNRHAAIASRSARLTRPYGFLTPWLRGIARFLRCYVAEGGMLDGAAGRAISRQHLNSTLLAYKLARRNRMR